MQEGDRRAIRIGCSGWNYKSWKDEFYEGKPARLWLEHYACCFDTLEVNNTFYRLPLASSVAAWVATPPPDFLFSVKASRYLTHVKRRLGSVRDPERPVAEAPTVNLSSPDRVLFPEDGITKGDLFEYYRAAGPALVPHLRDRPFTMKRYPHGIYGEVFFQKQAPKHIPSWIPTRQFRTWPREGGSRLVDFALVNSSEAVLFMVQNNCIDMNAWYSQVDKPHRPDFVLFDLDPPDGGFELAIEVAHLIRELLDELELPGYVKTSGADGIHVVAPITRRSTFEQTYDFAARASRLLEERHPGKVTTEWLKKKRRGVLVDHRQNGHGKTIASVYSVRPKPGAPVSTPLRWEELKPGLRPRDFSMPVALERLERHGDLFAPVLEDPRPLAPSAKKLERLRSQA